MFGNRAKSIATLGLLFVALPFNLITVGAALAYRTIAPPRRFRGDIRTSANQKTILVSGGKMTKALQLARSFHAAGHRVVLIESHAYRLTGHRFSRAVAAFHTVPAPDHPQYVEALLEIIRNERVDVFVPVCSPLSSLYDSRAISRLKHVCEIIHVAPDTIETLDDKYQFAQAAKSLGLRAPHSWLITDASEVEAFDFTSQSRPMILKSIAYDPIHRLDLTPLPRPSPLQTSAFVRSLPISRENPWILQELIPGTEFCTHGTVRNGELRVHCCCKSSAFQINYEAIDKPAIEAWLRASSAD